MDMFYESGIEFGREKDSQAYQGKMECFEMEFQKVKDVIPEILRLKENCESFKDVNSIHSFNDYVKTLTDNQLITLRAIYFCWRDSRNIRIDKEIKRNDFIKECVLTMESLNNYYDREINRSECSDVFTKKLRCLKDAFMLALDVIK